MTDADEEIILPPSIDPLIKKIGICHVTGDNAAGTRTEVNIRHFDPVITDEPDTMGGTNTEPSPLETVCFAIFVGYGYLTGPSRISERLQAALDAGPKRVNIVVPAKFPPEEFHMGIYQDVGAMPGSKGKSSTLFRVKPRDVKMLARHYWIIRIDLAP